VGGKVKGIRNKLVTTNAAYEYDCGPKRGRARTQIPARTHTGMHAHMHPHTHTHKHRYIKNEYRNFVFSASDLSIMRVEHKILPFSFCPKSF
jgi:hypothetical protein